MLIDTHCHLDIISQPLDGVIKRAEESGVAILITQGTNIASSQKAVALAAKFPNVYATVGIHPEEVSAVIPDLIGDPGTTSRFPVMYAGNDIDTIEQLLREPKVVAVGEVGLDYFTVARNDDEDEVAREMTKPHFASGSVRGKQIELFTEQIQLAIKYKKSLVIHDREAIEDTIATLQENWDPVLTGHTVFHCCPADERLLQFAKEHQIYIGIDGDITWSKKKQRFIATVPLAMLVLETDSPFLIPLSLKEQVKENEPKNITIIRDAVASLQNISGHAVEEMTTNNAQNLFQLS